MLKMHPWVLIFIFYFALLPRCLAKYGPSGKCGIQYGGAFCDPAKGGVCCSISGFCGETEEYCLVSSGCQLNCTDGTPTITSPTLGAIPTSSTVSSSATAGTSPLGNLTYAQRTGIIVGCAIFAACLVCLMIWLWWKHKERTQKPTRGAQHVIDDPLAGFGSGQRTVYVLGCVQDPRATQPFNQDRSIMPGRGSTNTRSPYGRGNPHHGRVYTVGSVSALPKLRRLTINLMQRIAVACHEVRYLTSSSHEVSLPFI